MFGEYCFDVGVAGKLTGIGAGESCLHLEDLVGGELIAWRAFLLNQGKQELGRVILPLAWERADFADGLVELLRHFGYPFRFLRQSRA